MTDLLIPLASPNPATTDWVPLGNTGAVPTTQPSVRVYRSTNQNINNTTWTAISFDTVRWDKGPSPHWAAGSPTRLVCQVAGTYIVSASYQWGASAVGTQRFAAIVPNSAGAFSGSAAIIGGTGGIAFASGAS